jgi:hypothetical protein
MPRPRELEEASVDVSRINQIKLVTDNFNDEYRARKSPLH